MPIKLGNTNISTIYKGTTPISAIYKGTTLLYQSASWELYSKVYFYNELVPTTINGKNVLNKAKIVKVSGNGVIENQLVQNGNFEDSSVWQVSEGGSVSIANNVATYTQVGSSRLRQIVNTIPNHKYLLTLVAKSNSNCNISMEIRRGWISFSKPLVANVKTKIYDFLTPTTTGDFPSEWFQIFTSVANSITEISKVMVIDLTLMFGTGNEPTTLTDNRIQNILNRGCIPYNLGKYKESDIGEFESTSNNIFDKSTRVVGKILNDSGVEANDANSNYFAQKIPVTPGQKIYIGMKIQRIYQYGQTGNWLGRLGTYDTSTIFGVFTVPSNVYFIQIQVLLSTYDEYTAYINYGENDLGYSDYGTLDTITFKAQLGGAINSHNTMEITNSAYVFTRNVWKVDLGTLDYQYRSDNTSNLRFISTTLSTMNKLTKPTQPDLLCEGGYTSVSGTYFDNNGSVDKIIRIDDDLGRFVIRNLAYTDSTTFKSSLSGTYAYYPLATPQVITIPRKHLGIVDLGSLTWEKATVYGRTMFRTIIEPTRAKTGNDGIVGNIYCENYLTTNYNSLSSGDNIISLRGIANEGVVIYDSSKVNMTTSEFKQSMAGQYLFYETENEVADIDNVVDIESGGTITSNWFSWVENQLFDHEKTTTSSNNVIFTNNNDGSFTINGTASEDFTRFDWIVYGDNVDLSHKFLLYIGKDFNGSSSTYYANMPYGIGDIFGDYMFISLNNQTTAPYLNINLIIRYNGVSINKTIKPQLIDLTLAFGSGNEPTDVNDPRIQEIIRLGYIPTNTTGTYKEVSPVVLPNIELSVKCK